MEEGMQEGTRQEKKEGRRLGILQEIWQGTMAQNLQEK